MSITAVLEENVYVLDAAATADKPIYMCTCGLSKNLPLCDGSHAKLGTPFKPATVQVVGDKLKIRSMKEVEIIKNRTENTSKKQDFSALTFFAFGSVLLMALLGKNKQ